MVVGGIISLDTIAQKLLNADGLCGSALFLGLLCCIGGHIVLVMLIDLREELYNAGDTWCLAFLRSGVGRQDVAERWTRRKKRQELGR